MRGTHIPSWCGKEADPSTCFADEETAPQPSILGLACVGEQGSQLDACFVLPFLQATSVSEILE